MKKRFLGLLFCAAIVSIAFTSCKDKESYFDTLLGDATELWPAELGVTDDGQTLYGYIDRSGKEVIKGKYTAASTFHEERAMVEVYDGSNYWCKYITKDGTEIGNFDQAENFACGLALVATRNSDGKLDYKFIDKDGNEVIKVGVVGHYRSEDDTHYLSKYLWVGEFSDGLALFQDTTGYYGFMDTKGEVVIPAQYQDAWWFSEGKAAVTQSGNGYYFIDKEGKIAVKTDRILEYNNSCSGILLHFMNDMCLVFDKSGFTFMDTKGKVLPYYYEDAFPFIGEKFTSAKLGAKWGLINKKGETVLNAQYDELYRFVEDRVMFGNKDEEGHMRCGIIDKDGKEILPNKYGDIDDCHNGLIHAKMWNADASKGWYYYFDKDGKEIWSNTIDYNSSSPAPARRGIERDVKAEEGVKKAPYVKGFTLGGRK